MEILVGCVHRHDPNYLPWRLFDNIVKNLKSEQKYYISKQ